MPDQDLVRRPGHVAILTGPTQTDHVPASAAFAPVDGLHLSHARDVPVRQAVPATQRDLDIDAVRRRRSCLIDGDHTRMSKDIHSGFNSRMVSSRNHRFNYCLTMNQHKFNS